jgi:predicted RNase H-like HicB family nuclease
VWERRSLPGLNLTPVRGAQQEQPVTSNRDGLSCYLGVICSLLRKDADEIQAQIHSRNRGEVGYYVASVPTLRGCHTQAKTLDTLMKRVREVIELCLEDGEEIDDALELVGIQQISL